MRKLWISIIAALVMSFGYSHSPVYVNAEKPVPSYAKWGTLAMKKTKEKYPNAQIIDYLHIGRISGTASSTEKFKLWLKEDNREFGVFVNIEFENRTEKVLGITFRETSR
jgi:hypothetical protein